MSTTLYQHEPHAHQPRNVNERHAAERQAHITRHQQHWRMQIAAGNERIAVWLTRHSGSMACAWVFAGIGIGSLVGVFTGNTFLAAVCGSLSSYFLQLVLLPVIQVGSNVLARHAELQADEQFHATQRTLHESQQTVRHLDAQDAELLRQTAMLTRLIAHLLPDTETPDASPVEAKPPVTTPVTTPVKRSRSRRTHA